MTTNIIYSDYKFLFQICNNLGNCHCFPGYRPPDCKFQIGSPGGSIDDGNVKKSGE